jgi:hypothetical protein
MPRTGRPPDQSDVRHGGHRSILAGKDIDGQSFGAASGLDIVPVRVANWVVLFRNSAIARAFDYVHSLCDDEATRVHIVTMSMGGIASAAWADAVNALYERGVFVVTAAGNNFGNLPTRFIVYPARFNRVVAACGVMADGRPYADLPIRKMAGCYGPPGKDATAIAAYTPNVPWAKFGCRDTIDMDGSGTRGDAADRRDSGAGCRRTRRRSKPMARTGCVEATRRALFDSVRKADAHQQGRVGSGLLHANAALDLVPASEAALKNSKTPVDSASFPLLRVLTGLAWRAPDKQRMLELRALQIGQQSHDLERLLIDFQPSRPEGRYRPADRPVAAGAAGRRGAAGAPHGLAGAEAGAGQGHAEIGVGANRQAGRGGRRRAAARPAAAQQPGHRARCSHPAQAAPVGLCPRSAAGQRHGFLRSPAGRARGALGEGSAAGPSANTRSHRRRPGRQRRLRAGRSQSSGPAGAKAATSRRRNPQFCQRWSMPLPWTITISSRPWVASR